MEIPKNIDKILDSKTIEKIYEEGLSNPTKEVGKLSTDILKTFRLFLAPFQLAATYQDRFERYLTRVREKVPEINQIEAVPEISGPVIQKLRYYNEDNIITELFLNLLARAIDKERLKEAHPSFPFIIEQLSPDEALILFELRDKDFNVTDTMDLDRANNRFYNRKIEKSEIPSDKLTYPDNIDVYYFHLESLSLVTWPVFNQTPINISGIQTGVRRYSKMTLTDFGKLFVKACIPDDIFIGNYLKNIIQMK